MPPKNGGGGPPALPKEAHFSLIATGLVVTLAAAAYAWWHELQSGKSLSGTAEGVLKDIEATTSSLASSVVDTASSVTSSTGTLPPMAILQPKPGTETTAKRIRTLGDLLTTVWPTVTGEPGDIPSAALEMALAHAGAEGTGYGQGWDGDMAGSNNVGSYQGSTETSWYKIVNHKDSTPQSDGTSKEYTTGFRYYLDGVGPDGQPHTAAENAAIDFLTSITKKPFPALAQLKSGSVLDYAAQMATLGYFEGFNPESPMGGGVKDWRTRWALSVDYVLNAWASQVAARVKRLAAVHHDATAEQLAGRICLYARSMGLRLPEIAAALSHAQVLAQVPADLVAPLRGPLPSA